VVQTRVNIRTGVSRLSRDPQNADGWQYREAHRICSAHERTWRGTYVHAYS